MLHPGAGLVLAVSPAPHDDVLHALVAFVVLLAVARLLAEVAVRWGQPPIVGELVAGLLLGPSLVSGLFPAIGRWIVPESVVAGHLLELLGLLGAMFLLLITGIETDVALIRHNARIALGVAAGGLVAPFGLGLVLAAFIPDDLLGDPGRRQVFALFLATALAVSAIPVVAKLLLDLGLIRRRFGQTALAAGMIDDTVAWLMLSVVLALSAGSGAGTDVILAAARIVLFIGLSATVGRFAVNRTLALIQDRGRSPDRVFTTVVLGAFGFGAIAQALGIEAVLGALVAGMLFGQNPRLPPDVVRRLHTLGLAVFSPVFFAIAGLKVDLASLAQPRLIVLSLVILTVAVSGKILGAYVGARLVGVDHWTAAAYGSALNARGAVGIIIASIGLSLEILSVELYSIVVLMAVVTSVMTPAMVRSFLARVAPDPAEEARLARESDDDSGYRRPRHILIPVRTRDEVASVHRVTAEIVGRIAGATSVTLLSVTERGGKPDTERFLGEVAKLFAVRPRIRVVTGDNPVGAILEAASADHDLVILGAHETSLEEDTLFDPVADSVARLAPCPTLIVAGRHAAQESWRPRRILLPTDGTASARRAARLAFTIADDADVTVMHVVDRSPHARVGAPGPSLQTRVAQGRDIVDDTAELALAYDLTVLKEVTMSSAMSDSVISKAEEISADLVVMGTNLRPGSVRLHLGPQVEAILHHAPCPVILLNSG